MSILETIRMAGHALTRNKTRTFLTTLGVIIGVGAVVAMVGIGEGAKSEVERAFSSMGTNVLILMPGSSNVGGVHGGSGTQPTLTWADLKAISSELPSVRYAAPVLRGSSQIVSEEQNWTTTVSGTTSEYFDIRNWPIAKGQMFTPSDVDGGNKVVLLGKTVVDRLFGPGSDPLGQTIRIRNIPFQVIGVLAQKGQSPMGQDYDDAAFIPVSTYQSKIQGGLAQFISGTVFIGAVSSDRVSAAESEVAELLRERHRLAPGDDDDFSIRNLTELASAREEGTRTITTLLACIAAISLLVGGIGIMNIMLVSVTERTREIGIRRALGARPKDILLQFLVEALTLSVAGGLLGLLIGVGFARWLSSSLGWPLLLRVDVMAVSVCFSGLVGICFGLYPARKASILKPVDALRYE
jgi:putative ABC transport system permease protein